MVLHRSDGIPVDELALIKVVVLGLVQGALYRRRDQVIVAWVSGLGEDWCLFGFDIGWTNFLRTIWNNCKANIFLLGCILPPLETIH